MGLEHLGHTRAEHLADGVVHFLSVVAALAGAAVLLTWSLTSPEVARPAPLVIYAAGLVATFGFSAAYNMTHQRAIRAILRRLDHAAIFIMIAGTYTPIALLGLGGITGTLLVLAAWSITGLGIFLKLFFFHRAYRAVFFLYLAQGWLAAIVIVPLARTLSLPVLLLISLGGLVYTLGTIVHHRENWAYNRAIWHGFVLVAASMHFAAILTLMANGPAT